MCDVREVRAVAYSSASARRRARAEWRQQDSSGAIPRPCAGGWHAKGLLIRCAQGLLIRCAGIISFQHVHAARLRHVLELSRSFDGRKNQSTTSAVQRSKSPPTPTPSPASAAGRPWSPCEARLNLSPYPSVAWCLDRPQLSTRIIASICVGNVRFMTMVRAACNGPWSKEDNLRRARGRRSRVLQNRGGLSAWTPAHARPPDWLACAAARASHGCAQPNQRKERVSRDVGFGVRGAYLSSLGKMAAGEEAIGEEAATSCRTMSVPGFVL